jgi:hypothetical protein
VTTSIQPPRYAFAKCRLREIPGVDRVETLERVTETHDWGVFERAGDL